MAQKLAEEATEVVIEAVRRERSAVIHESVDLLYNLVVLWSELGITSPEIWAEMDRRQALFWDGGEVAEGRWGGRDASRGRLAKEAVECCEMRFPSADSWVYLKQASGLDDCRSVRAGNFRLRQNAGRQRADHQSSPC
jgi:hypothetical protein